MFTELKKTEAGRAAKPGDIAPYQIVVEKQDTGMPPGPIVGDLNSVGIPAKIMGGSVQIQKRTVILEEGEVFEGELGMMLSEVASTRWSRPPPLWNPQEWDLFEPSTLDIDCEQFGLNDRYGCWWFQPRATSSGSPRKPYRPFLPRQRALAVALEAASLRRIRCHTWWLEPTPAPRRCW